MTKNPIYQRHPDVLPRSSHSFHFLLLMVNEVLEFSHSRTMSALHESRETVRYLSRKEVSEERADLVKTLNGDAFFPLKSWPEDIRMAFWRKPIGDRDTFKLMLFCLGNGCSPNLISRWILLSQAWAPEKAEKRARQIDFVLNTAESFITTWITGNCCSSTVCRNSKAKKTRKQEKTP